jgi:hypothetical protein
MADLIAVFVDVLLERTAIRNTRSRPPRIKK